MFIVILLFLAQASTKISFGSCHGQFFQHNFQIFESILNSSPDIFIWLGDTIYADLESWPFHMSESNLPGWQAQYDALKSNPIYSKLRSSIKITGIYDDHDFGQNDSDSLFKLKEKSQQMFMNFIDEQVDHEGIYRKVYLNEKVRILLLDVRYFKVKDSDLLGEAQWAWLEHEMHEDYLITIIASGVQVNVDDRVFANTERWDQENRERLFDLIDEKPGVVFLSGDIHFGEILWNRCKKFPILEVTASGLSHTEATLYGPAAAWFIESTNAMSYHRNKRIFEKHFGEIEFDWEKEVVWVRIKDTFGNVIVEEIIGLDELLSPLQSVGQLCGVDPMLRHYCHFFACLGVFYLPVVLWGWALVSFLRKYTNSF